MNIKQGLFAIILFLPCLSYAKTYQTYVIHTYGNPDLAGVIQQELDSRGGGSAVMYQDKLVVRATAEDYAQITSLISQIDTLPASLTVSVLVGNQVNQSDKGGSVAVGINQRIWVNGQYQNQKNTANSSQVYTVRTVSGRQFSIGASTLLSLPNWQSYQRNNQVWVNFGTSWAVLTDGVVATAKVLNHREIELNIRQSATNPTSNRSYFTSSHLENTVIIPRSQWVQIGQMRQETTQNRSGFSFGQSHYQQIMPIWVRVD